MSYETMGKAVNEDRELGWEDSIENDGGEYILLPEGDYPFEVVKFERGRHAGSDKLPPCNKAVLDIKVTGPQGSVNIRHQLFLHTKTEGMLCAFFAAIGQRQEGERINMNWGAVTGATGHCKIAVRDWINKDGQARQSNEIKKFYAGGKGPAAQGSLGFQAGKF